MRLAQRLTTRRWIGTLLLAVLLLPGAVQAEAACRIALGAREGIYWVDLEQQMLVPAAGNADLGAIRWQRALGWSADGATLYSITNGILSTPVYAFTEDDARPIRMLALQAAAVDASGQQLAYIDTESPLTPQTQRLIPRLNIMRLPDGTPRPVATLPAIPVQDAERAAFSRPFFLPGGMQIGLIWVGAEAEAPARLLLFERDTGASRTLATLPARRWPTGQVPQASPDGRYIALTLLHEELQQTPTSLFDLLPATSGLYLIALDTGDVTLLAENASTPRWLGANSADSGGAPEAPTLTYIQNRMLVVEPIGVTEASPRRYALPDAYQIEVSPSGQHIAYTVAVKSQNPLYADQLRIRRLATGESFPIRYEGHGVPQFAFEIVWHPGCAPRW